MEIIRRILFVSYIVIISLAMAFIVWFVGKDELDYDRTPTHVCCESK